MMGSSRIAFNSTFPSSFLWNVGTNFHEESVLSICLTVQMAVWLKLWPINKATRLSLTHYMKAWTSSSFKNEATIIPPHVCVLLQNPLPCRKLGSFASRIPPQEESTKTSHRAEKASVKHIPVADSSLCCWPHHAENLSQNRFRWWIRDRRESRQAVWQSFKVSSEDMFSSMQCTPMCRETGATQTQKKKRTRAKGTKKISPPFGVVLIGQKKTKLSRNFYFSLFSRYLAFSRPTPREQRIQLTCHDSSTLPACDRANFRTGLEANALDQAEAFPEVERKKVKQPRKRRTLETAEAGRFASLRKKSDCASRSVATPCRRTLSTHQKQFRKSSKAKFRNLAEVEPWNNTQQRHENHFRARARFNCTKLFAI